MKQTQGQRVLAYLDEYGAITPLEALRDLGVMRLAARVFDLRQQGEDVRRRMVPVANRRGQTVQVAEYYRA